MVSLSLKNLAVATIHNAKPITSDDNCNFTLSLLLFFRRKGWL